MGRRPLKSSDRPLRKQGFFFTRERETDWRAGRDVYALAFRCLLLFHMAGKGD